MSWFQSACPRCHGMMFVPATFLGHSIVCDKCGVTFVPNPIGPLPPQQMPQPIGFGMPSSYPPPAYYPSPPPHRPPEPPPSDYSYPAVPTPPPNMPGAGGERQSAANPFSSPLPEIEILPPPSAVRQSSRKRSSGARSSGSKRSRSSSSADAAMTPNRDGERERRRRSKRTSRSSAAPPISEEAVRAAREEVELIERRLRRARQRRNVSFALVTIGMIAMSLVGYLMITRFRPTRSASPEPTTPPASSPTPAAGATDVQAWRTYPIDLPRS